VSPTPEDEPEDDWQPVRGCRRYRQISGLVVEPLLADAAALRVSTDRVARAVSWTSMRNVDFRDNVEAVHFRSQAVNVRRPGIGTGGAGPKCVRRPEQGSISIAKRVSGPSWSRQGPSPGGGYSPLPTGSSLKVCGTMVPEVDPRVAHAGVRPVDVSTNLL